MIGSICGDIIGSTFEFNNKRKDTYTSLFSDKSTFTDDSILTIATMDAILNNRSYGDVYYEYASNYPNRGYGKMFAEMVAKGKLEPYDSYGNGSAMRVSPIGFAFKDGVEVFEEARKSASCTHNNAEGIKGAEFVACTIFELRARPQLNKLQLQEKLEILFRYDLKKKTSEFERKFDVTCQGTIPRCWAIFNESNDFESAMRLAISMGGDVDTNCCIVGGFCDAYYGLPSKDIIQAVYERLPTEMSDVVTKFVQKFIDSSFVPPLFEPKSSTINSILSLSLED